MKTSDKKLQPLPTAFEFPADSVLWFESIELTRFESVELRVLTRFLPEVDPYKVDADDGGLVGGITKAISFWFLKKNI